MDNTDDLMPSIMELYKEWCRLQGYALSEQPINIMIDEATGAEKARMTEFVQWLSLEVMTRLPKDDTGAAPTRKDEDEQ